MRYKSITLLALLLLVPLVADSTLAARTIFVDADATGTGSGTTWANAYRFLQDGLAAAFNGDEIRVAQGIYRPDRGGGKQLGDRTATFSLVNGVTLKGGYAGFGEATPDTRDVKLYKTILSGDLKGDDTGEVDDPSRNENSLNVVSAMEVPKTTLDGFTITGGNTYGGGDGLGGAGMNSWVASPTVTDCIFSRNRASGCGGGLSSLGGTPVLTGCTFEGNWSGDRGCGAWFSQSNATLVDCVFTNNRGQSGGGIAMSWSDPVLTNCTFNGNAVRNIGGGVYMDWSKPKLTHCTCTNNSSGSDGAGIYSATSNAVVTDCLFDGNQGGFAGGALVNQGSNATLTNCTLMRNSSYSGGGVCHGYGGAGGNLTVVNCAFIKNVAAANGGAIEMVGGTAQIANCTFIGNTASSYGGGVSNGGGGVSDAKITNCVLWGNKPFEVCGGTNTVTYSDVQGGTGQPWFGRGSLDTDPLFADPNGRLSPNSPCVDAGDNAAAPAEVTTDLDGNRRIQRAVVDMGAYEVNVPPVDLLDRAIELVNRFDVTSFVSSTSRAELVSGLEAATASIEAGLCADALTKLCDDILPRVDGCGKIGQPDTTDWIVACEAQQEVYPLMLEAIAAIEPLAVQPKPAVTPVAHWMLDGGTGAEARDSAGTNHASVYGAKWVAGRIGGALRFDGMDDYVDCGNAQVLAPEKMTVAFWASVEGRRSYQYILGKARDAYSERDYTFFTGSDGKLEFGFSQEGTKRMSAKSAAALPLSEWVHVVATRDGATACLYLDGQLQISGTYSFAVTRGSHSLRIGAIGQPEWAGFFKGMIDDVRIYDKALSAQETQRLYEQGSP